jgi:hypothetical protein
MIKEFLVNRFFSSLHYAERLPFGNRLLKEVDRAFDLNYCHYRLQHEARNLNAWLGGRPSGDALTLSIVTPTYGIALPYIKEFVSSVRQQTHGLWELCLCLDGPQPPGVKEWLFRLAHKDKRVKLATHDKNLGICASTRSAMTLAQGDVVVFCDADDLLHAKALQCLASSFAEDESVDFVYSDLDTCTDYGFRTSPYRKPDWSPDLLASTNYINHVVALRREVLDDLDADQVFPDDVAGAQDWNLCFLATRKARSVRHIPFVLYHWRRRPGSVAENPNAKPYVFDAAIRLLNREYHLRHGALQAIVDPVTRMYRPSIRLEERPSFQVVHVSVGSTLLLKVLGDESETWKVLDEIDRQIVATCPDQDQGDLVFFDVIANGTTLKTAKRPLEAPLPDGFQGESLEPLAAFAIQNRVACVWPFLVNGQRNGYTVAGHQGLVPWHTSFSAFGLNASNVLTGPLHGCLIKAQTLLSLGGLTQAARRFELATSCTADRLGAALGLEALTRGLRNVSTPGVACARPTPPITLGHGLSHDPFLF